MPSRRMSAPARRASVVRHFSCLNLREGQVIEIVGKRTTAAIVLPPYPEDEGLDVIRLDGLQRGNAGVSIGDYVDAQTRGCKACQARSARAGAKESAAGRLR